jgi:phosphatidate cytidylyltransferase
MLTTRLLVAVILLPVGLVAIYLGGWVFVAIVALLLGLAAREYNQLFRACGLQPAGVLVIAGVLLLVLGRAANGFESAPWITSSLILASMVYHLFSYERGRDQAATDFSVTVAGTFYLGWIGAYLISLRTLPDGHWWVFLVLATVWLADSGAYFIGRGLGRRRFSPRLSPKKTWEGYLGGLACATLGAALLAAVWPAPGALSFDARPAISALEGALLGLLIGGLTPLGDLGESMIKRQCGAKDSGNLLPGHGGIFDRIDSWLWAGVIGYYALQWFL